MSNESVDDLIRQLETLRLQQERVTQRLVVARAREARNDNYTRARDNRARNDIFAVGGRVRILNRVRVTTGLAVTDNDRRATITRITPTRIYFRTVNGNETWRARSNLRLVQNDEIW